ncbi:hypothetical protein PB2503_10159 [Parvularcula bermudensis HTCC2503]|uniref:Anti-sigma factor NepR domain-containing protein n=1 Tax=Parvularcula bermudensis (strain ATCC BAA-594 / HTCC2503 / KCTC 12087) TaxID=314260 RepID=E0TFF9_PARBH|nr:NepR family anti-sigma factor [Parvularcula bermudensis]ADM10083.1 hypothetical protein PB2503_10159 [Parvularcula bermudensis HTCC2503]
MTDSDEDGRKPREGRARGQKLGDHLRTLYDQVVHEDIPQDFLKLLEDAERNSSRADEPQRTERSCDRDQ